MATITITISGTNGFNSVKSFTTDDANVTAIVDAYISDRGIASRLAADGTELPRDAEWAVAVWMDDAISRAAQKAEQHMRARAAEIAVAAVQPIVVAMT